MRTDRNRTVNRHSILLYLTILLISVASCIVRYPDFETTLWSASDTNYQCLMNAKAMLEADEKTASFLPLITFSEDTDYGLEYSSGAFDRETGKYFYYISFPSFPFMAFVWFLKLTGLAVNERSLYIFCSILFCISALAVVRLFETIFGEKLSERWIAFVTGITYIFSVEIMHSLGLTYWGQNWYMIIYPLLLMKFLKFEHLERPTCKDYLGFAVLGFVLLQTEWSGYFALFAFWIVCLLRLIKNKERKYSYFVIGIAVEVIIAASLFVILRVNLVGFQEFVNVIKQRTAGRSRISDYSIFAVEKSLIYSFGNSIILILGYAVWLFVYHLKNKKKIFTRNILANGHMALLILFLVPLLENHLFTNHALTYSMDRMKWYFVINFILLYIISELISLKHARRIICYSMGCVMVVSLFSYLFIENNYRWNDERWNSSSGLEQFINANYSDNVLGQLGNNSVWGYSKMLFGHGIVKETSVRSLIKRAQHFGKRYAVALNDYELSYTQKWYSSAIIYDSEERKYIVAGSIWNQFHDKINDLKYLENARYIDICVNCFDQIDQRITFKEDAAIKEKEMLIFQHLKKYDLQKDIIYFVTEVDHVPSLIMVDNQNSGEWLSGVSLERNRLIFLNTAGNRELLYNAKLLSSNGVSADITAIFIEGDFIYVDLGTDQVTEYSYPNAISILYEED